MPTDAADIPEAPPEEPPTKTESIERRGMRLGFGVATMFTLGAGLAWPLWTIGSIFTNLLLQAPAPVPPKAARGILLFSAISMLFVWYVAQVLLAYPFFFFVALVASIFGIFRFAAKGGQLLIVVLLMIAVLLIPTLLLTSPKLAIIAAGWLFMNIAIAILASWTFFVIAPPKGTPPPKPPKAPVSNSDANKHAFRMTLITAPYAVLHFSMGWTNVLPLIFIALLSTALSGAKGTAMGKGLLLANVLGGVIAIAMSEVLVMAPFYPLLAALSVAVFMLGAKTLVSGGKLAPLAGSAMNGFIVLLGGVIAPFGDGAEIAFIDRLLSIGFAVFYVAVAYAVVDGLMKEQEAEKAARNRQDPDPEPIDV